MMDIVKCKQASSARHCVAAAAASAASACRASRCCCCSRWASGKWRTRSMIFIISRVCCAASRSALHLAERLALALAAETAPLPGAARCFSVAAGKGKGGVVFRVKRRR